MEDLVIVGAGGLAREIAFLIEDINRSRPSWNLLGFISGDGSGIGQKIGKYPIYNDDDWLVSTRDRVNVVIGTGNPATNSKILDTLKTASSLVFPNLVHPNVVGDWDRITIGEGNLVCAGNTFTTDITIGSFNIFNLNGTVGHDTVIGDCNVLNPTFNISGTVSIGNRVLLGTGAQILQGIKIADDAVIGAGAVVTKDIVEAGTYVGMPAKKLG